MTEVTMSKKIFISHATHEAEYAKQVCEYLENHEYQYWIAPRDILPGHSYGEEIMRGIEQADLFLLIFSKKANESQHVLREEIGRAHV